MDVVIPLFQSRTVDALVLNIDNKYFIWNIKLNSTKAKTIGKLLS